MKRMLVTALILTGFSLTGAEYHVSVDAGTGGNGSAARPFQTIQAAAARMTPGDICIVHPGLYRETVTPKHSGLDGKPIVFLASPKGSATIAGTEPVRGWAKYSGAIYKATMAWSLGKNNQVFVDGAAMREARWPNDKDGDPMTPDGMSIDGGGVDNILCSQFPADWKSGELTGAVVWALADKMWTSWTATIDAYDPQSGKISFSSPSLSTGWVIDNHNPGSKKGQFYLVGALKLLDAPGEWFYDEKEKTLYLWAPGGEDPNSLRVEAKARQLGFALTDRSWITVDGINLNACAIDMDRAEHCQVKNLRARHISHTRGGKTTHTLYEKSGIYMSGEHNLIESCEIADSTGSGVSLRGTDNAVVNCWIHHIDTIGAYCSPINMEGLRHLVSHNTIEYAGRDCIKLGGTEHVIEYNDIGFPGRICHDLGAVYAFGIDGGDTRISHNFVHDNPGRQTNVGIYLDNYMKNYLVDHNVVWNVGNGIRLNRPTGFCMVLNNTVFGDITNSWGPWKGQKVQWGCHVMNNLTSGPIKMNPEVVTRANIRREDLSGAFDVRTRARGPAAPGTGEGVPVPGVTGEPPVDAGACQNNWCPGHDFNAPPQVSWTPPRAFLRNYIRNAAFEYARYSTSADENADPIPHWTTTGSAKVELHRGGNFPPANQRNAIQGNSLMLGGQVSGCRQVITGLRPDTPYFFSGYVKHDATSHAVFAVSIGNRVVAETGSAEVKLGKKQSWRFVCLRFATGPGDTEATVSITNEGPGKVWVDDTGVVPATFYTGQ